VQHAAGYDAYDGRVRRLYRLDAGPRLAPGRRLQRCIGYDVDEQPMMFASTAAMHGVALFA
jgi:hypothetical protein